MSRGRKRKTKNNNKKIKPFRQPAFGPEDACNCPVCSAAAEFDPDELIDGLLTGVEDLTTAEDPLDAELAGAILMSITAGARERFDEALIGGLLPEFETRPSTRALALVLAIGSVTGGRVARAAHATADRLVKAGVSAPRWAAELAEPVTVSECWRISDPLDFGSVLAATFHRAGRSHTMVLTVDHRDCGAATEAGVLDADQLPDALTLGRAQAGDGEIKLIREALDPAELRWWAEQALDAREVHDRGDEELGLVSIDDTAPDDEDDGPSFPVMAALWRARLAGLPLSSRPKAPHGGDGHPGALAALDALDALDAFAVGKGRAGRRTRTATLPAARKKSDSPAPIYQIKVGLRGAKPPIWRRLEVPADISLGELHAVIQLAFDWEDCHLHVFSTPYGEFGVPDGELEHRDELTVTLEQVAPGARSKIRYTYDFGDDWEHDIEVEKVLDPDDAVGYPRCTGGRRAAPPEDCGGVWGYAVLLDALADPAHPDHDYRMEWLGLDKPTDLDPAAFDTDEVTKALSRPR